MKAVITDKTFLTKSVLAYGVKFIRTIAQNYQKDEKIKIQRHSQVQYFRGLGMLFGEEDLNLYVLTLAFCPRLVLKAGLVKANPAGGEHNDHGVVGTCPVPFVLSEVSKQQHIDQIQPSDKLYNWFA